VGQTAANIPHALRRWGSPEKSIAIQLWEAVDRAQHLESTRQKLETEYMRAIVQRVSRAKVTVSGQVTGEIGPGLLVLLGVGKTDSQADANYLADKITALRIFEDADGKMNRSVAEAGGAILVVSQFTLYGDVRRGKRPSFDAAAPPDQARELYEYLVQRVRGAGLRCETGKFQEMMSVELVNEGPVTILLDSSKGF
jgi:D-tyrosyl-tRNA(Tyr) deacylase